MWQRHWNLDRDPFDGRAAGYVATPIHAEAVARLVHAVESSDRSARLTAAPGLGKSAVLARAIETTRSPDRRFARVSGPIDGPGLFTGLAAGLGSRVAPDAGRASAWRALVEAARLWFWQGARVVLAVDDCHVLASPADRGDLDRLGHLVADPASPLTVILVGRPDGQAEADDWDLPIRLASLTRSETAGYVEAKLRVAGRDEPTFTPRGITRLHLLSGGVPRGIDRLAGLALMAAASRGLEMVGPEIVEEAGREWGPSPDGMAIPGRVR